MQEFMPQAIEFAQKHTFLTIAWFAVLFMTLFTFFKSATQKYRVITNPEAVRLMNDEEAVVIDLRPIDEFQRGHIIGSVNLLPTEIKNQNVGKIEHHKEKPLIIVDVNGVSSATSAELLTKQGFEQNQQPEVAAEEQQEAVLQIQRIYVKDVSFEAPNLPHIFHQEWKPKLGFDLSTEAIQVGEDLYEVTLNINVETTMEDSGDVAFICEVKQAGVFTISGLEDVQMAHCLTSQCPNMLFPYARELISNLVNRGTFPALNLSPVNFDALFIDYMNKQQAAAEAEENQETQH